LAERVNILGVDVDAVTMAEAVDVVRRAMDTRAGVMVATANAEMLMRATHDDELRPLLNASALVVPDGAGTVWAARHLGHAMPERVAGYDLAQELLRCAVWLPVAGGAPLPSRRGTARDPGSRARRHRHHHG